MTDDLQQQAIHHVRGPCITMAGPGAGKTFVLIRRIAYLTESCRIPPSQLLVITFSRAAAIELRERYQKAVRPEFSGVTFATFHSFFFHILCKFGNFTTQSLLDTQTRQYILKSACEKANITDAGRAGFYGRTASEISYIKNSGVSCDEYEPAELTREELKAIFFYYEQKKDELEKIDFDDMLIKTYELLRNDPGVLDTYRSRYSYILADEAQDTNEIQYNILKMLAMPLNNLFLVGDDDQAIYSFRGAMPKLLLNFTSDYPDAKKVVLSRNYRCDREIVRKGLKLIKNNTERFEKQLSSASRLEGSIRYLPHAGYKDEAEDIIRRIIRQKEIKPLEKIAVLYRNNETARTLITEAENRGFYINGKKHHYNWFDSETVRIVEAYFYALITEKQDYIIQIMNVPQRYLPRKGLEDSTVDYNRWRKYFINDNDVINRISGFERELKMMKNLPSYAVVAYIMYTLNVKGYLEKNNSFDEKALSKLLEIAESIPDKKRFIKAIDGHRMKKEKDTEETSEANRLYCYTFHGSKGLEFDHVYIIDANESITPSRYATTLRAIEEERRLFYVAMTRAKHSLTISAITRRGKEILYPSRFIREIADDQESASLTSSSNTSDTRRASSSDSILSMTGLPSSSSKYL